MSTKGLNKLNRSQASIIFMYAVGGKLLLMLTIDIINDFINITNELINTINEGHLRNIVVRTKVTVTFRDIKPSKNISGK